MTDLPTREQIEDTKISIAFQRDQLENEYFDGPLEFKFLEQLLSAAEQAIDLQAENHRLRLGDMSVFDYERLVEWINNPNRKDPSTAFTAGALRTAAIAIQDSGVLRQVIDLKAKLVEAERERDREKQSASRFCGDAQRFATSADLMARQLLADSARLKRIGEIVGPKLDPVGYPDSAAGEILKIKFNVGELRELAALIRDGKLEVEGM